MITNPPLVAVAVTLLAASVGLMVASIAVSVLVALGLGAGTMLVLQPGRPIAVSNFNELPQPGGVDAEVLIDVGDDANGRVEIENIRQPPPETFDRPDHTADK